MIKQTQLDLTLRRTSNSQELAKIDPDTGLRQDNGPSLNKAIAVSLQRNFSHGAIYFSCAKPIPEIRNPGFRCPKRRACVGMLSLPKTTIHLVFKCAVSSSSSRRNRLLMVTFDTKWCVAHKIDEMIHNSPHSHIV